MSKSKDLNSGTQSGITIIAGNNNVFSERPTHSTEFLSKMKNLIHSNFKEATWNLNYHKNILSGKDSNGTNDTSSGSVKFENSAEIDKEYHTQRSLELTKYVKDLKNAAFRIENKTYGYDRITGKLISEDELMSAPHRTLSVATKNLLDK